MGDYLRYAMFDKYFKQIGNCVGAVDLPGGHRQGLARTTCCPGTTPGAARPTRRPAGRGGSAPATTTSATRTRSRPGRWPTRPSCDAAGRRPRGADWTNSLEPAARVLPVAAVRRGRHRRRRDEQLGRRVRPAAGRHADVLRHVLRRAARSTTTRRRNQWFGMQVWSHAAGRRAYYADRQRARPRRCWTSGCRGRSPTPRSAPAATSRSRPTCSGAARRRPGTRPARRPTPTCTSR